VHVSLKIEMEEIEHRGKNGAVGVKKRKVDQLDTPATNSPRASLTPRSATPTVEGRYLAERGITFHDDEVDDCFEYIRIPKKRDFEIITVAHSEPGKRTTSNLPLIVTRHLDNAQVTMWAKLDTGADVNVINRSTIKKLFGDKEKTVIHPLTRDDKDFVMLGHASLHPTHYVLLNFQAGRSKNKFEKEKFFVVDDDWGNPDDDGVPNVVLGWSFLLKNHVVMIDVSDWRHFAQEESREPC
jgi:hypothetical protein